MSKKINFPNWFSIHPYIVVIFITFFLLVVVEIIAGVFLERLQSPQKTLTEEDIKKLYPDETPSFLTEMFRDTASYQSLFEYSPFIELSLNEIHKKHLNIQEDGYRNSVKLKDLDKLDSEGIFVFGGSTTFGVGVGDNQTIPYYMSEFLNIKNVYNFGVPTYYSTIERIRFFNLINQGIKPRAAIFIDGLNDFVNYSVPDRSNVSNRLSTGMSIDYPYLIKKIIGSTSSMQLINTLMNKEKYNIIHRLIATENEVEKAYLRLISNREIIGAVCKEKGIICIFVDHPVPTVHYDNSKRPIPLDTTKTLVDGEALFGGGINAKYGYKLLADYYNMQSSKTHLDLSKVNTAEPVYIDRFHFSKMMNKEIALHISERLKLLGW